MSLSYPDFSLLYMVVVTLPKKTELHVYASAESVLFGVSDTCLLGVESQFGCTTSTSLVLL